MSSSPRRSWPALEALPPLIGRTLGPYRIVDKLGQGGMGEVYSARDTRLDRTVAIKILPERSAGDREARERFDREARAISSLNHPNICSLHDIGHDEGIDFLVMELVPGETLDARLTRGPIALDDALPIARQIAIALEAAHEAGIIHRDLKPSNVKLREDGTVKVLDFGLAKAIGGSGDDDRGGIATITSPAMTQAGMILGTAAYMSPEQARGRRVDKRADIWAFGCVLYEMLAGRRAFAAPTTPADAVDSESVTDILAAIVTREPDWNALPAKTPQALRRLLRRCLAKDVRQRLRDVGDAVIELDETAADRGEQPSEPRTRRVFVQAAFIGLALLAVIAAFSAGRFSRATSTATPSRTWKGEMFTGPAVAFQPVISPDGQTLAFQAMVDGETQVAVMNANATGWRVLTHDRTRGGISTLAWARDGTRIYFDRVSHSIEGIFSVSVFGEDVRPVLENALAPRPLKDGSLIVVTTSGGDRRPRLHRFWPDSTPRKLEPLNAFTSTRVLDPAVQVFPDDREGVFYGRPADAANAADELHVIDLSTGATRTLAPWLSVPPPYWKLPIAVNDTRVFVALPSGDQVRIVAVPRRAGSSEQLETLTAVTQPMLHLHVGPDDTIYGDQYLQPHEQVLYSPATRTVDERQLLGIGVATLGNPSLPLADGRVLVMYRERVMVHARGRAPAPLVDTREPTRAPVAALGHDRVLLLVGTPPRLRVAVISIADGRIQSFVDGIDGSRVTALAGSPDGRWVFYAIDEEIWRMPAAGGTPLRLQPGGQVAVDPQGKYIVILAGEAQTIRLMRVPIDGGPGTEIPMRGEWRAAAGGLSANGVGADGRIALRLASKGSWYWPLGLVDPRTGSVEVVDLGRDLDVGGGWTPDGRILAITGPTLSTMWRFRPESLPRAR